jgi:hypothetical protein
MKYTIIFIIILFLSGCATTLSRADQQRQYYEGRQQLDQALTKSVNDYNNYMNQFNEQRDDYYGREERFYNSLSKKQQEEYEIYLNYKKPEYKFAVDILLTEEQQSVFNFLIKDHERLKGWAKSMNEWRQSILEAKQSSDRTEQLWREVNQQTDQLEQQQAAAWGRVQDSIQKLGDDIYRRSYTPYLIKVPTPTQP